MDNWLEDFTKLFFDKKGKFTLVLDHYAFRCLTAECHMKHTSTEKVLIVETDTELQFEFNGCVVTVNWH